MSVLPPAFHTRATRALPLLLAGALLAGAGALSAQQPADTAKPRDARTQILERLRKLDVRPDSTRRDSTALPDSALLTPDQAASRRRSAPVAMEQDSMMKALEALRGFTATEYKGKTARFAADTGRLVLTGPATVQQGEQAMTADSILDYDQNTQIACGYGKPVLTGAGQSNPVESSQVCYDVARRMGVAYGARTKFEQGATAWYVNGHKVYTSGANDLYGRDSEFTDCDLKVPHYHFTAKELKMVRGNLIVAKDVTLSFADVPVFWLPFMVQSMEQGRRTGLLMPRFSINDLARTQTNYQRHIDNVGIFWAINDHMGSQLALDWFSGRYTGLNAGLDYDFHRQFFNGGLSATRFWRDGGSKELAFNLRNSWRPDERTSMQLNASYASSSSFVRDQSFDPRELNRSIDSNLSMQRQFGWGSLDFSGHRKQYLQNDRVTMNLPTVSLSLAPLSLFRRSDGTSLITWNGGGNFSQDRDQNGAKDLTHYVLDPQPSTRASSGAFNSSLQLGKFSWGQSLSYNDSRNLLRPSFTQPKAGQPAGGTALDTIAAMPAMSNTGLTWSTSLGYQQRVLGLLLSPSLSLSGESRKEDRDTFATPGFVAAPMRASFGMGTQVEVYGFWPGVGPFSRIRHKIVPALSYSYSPSVRTTSDIQRRVFGQVGSLERNFLSIGLSQTFEAKFRETTPPDSAAAQDTTTSLDGEPRRLKTARKITLLSLSGWAAAYDFTTDTITGRRIGFQAPQISTSARSDLIPGLEFSLTHDIFRYEGPNRTGPRHFSPFLTSASTNFQLDEKSWLFRMLGLATARLMRTPASPTTPADSTGTRSPIAAQDEGQGPSGSIVPGGRTGSATTPAASGAVGSWHGSFTYTLSRQRPDNLHDNFQPLYSCNPVFQTCGNGLNSQMLQGNLNFQPTKAWSVAWRTSYNFTQGQFADHMLTLTRDLHDWQANFDFVKAQNGNFSFQFRVNLKAQPDLKFDYSQRGGNAYQGPGY